MHGAEEAQSVSERHHRVAVMMAARIQKCRAETHHQKSSQHAPIAKVRVQFADQGRFL
jgi:hypothetical protein